MDLFHIFQSPPAIAGGLCAIAVVMLIAEMMSSNKRRIERRVGEETRRRVREQVQSSKLFKNWKSAAGNASDETRQTLIQSVEQYLTQSGLDLTIVDLVRRTVLFSVSMAIVPAMFSYVVAAIVAAFIGAFIPAIHVVLCHRKRIRKLTEQLPEVFDFMRRAVQAGQTIQNALQLAAKQSNAPVSEELQYCCEQQNLGLPYEVTLRDLATRTGIVEFKMFSVALLMQRQAGGDPTEVLENLSELTRKRGKLAMKIRAITGEGRMQANVLSVLPFCAFIGIYFLDRDYALVLMSYPYLLAGLVVAIFCGIMWIRRIVSFQY